ncbi:hypothetical protein V1521DRAFT_302366 [Lipomyces starkeyi]
MQAVHNFLDQWWVDGNYERWAEVFIRKYLNFGISTTSRLEGSHGAMKGVVTSSSGTLYSYGWQQDKSLSHRSIKSLSFFFGSNENLLVRLEIRNQVDTSGLCTVISSSALELVYTELKRTSLRFYAVVPFGIVIVCSSDPAWHSYCCSRHSSTLESAHSVPALKHELAAYRARWTFEEVSSQRNTRTAHIS